MGNSIIAQQNVLERVSFTYRRDSQHDNWMRRLCVRAIRPWLSKSDSVLEVGCSDGLMTEMLSEIVATVDVVEASKHFAMEAERRNLKNARIHHAMVENFRPQGKFDRIVVTWVLTHVLDAESLLRVFREWLAPGGLIFVAVPNARVLSRQLALHMGLISDLYGLTENDKNHGHVRAYDRTSLKHQLEKSGYKSIFECGLMLKPLADFQMDQLYEKGILADEHVEGLYRLGLEYPDLSSALLSVCKANENE